MTVVWRWSWFDSYFVCLSGFSHEAFHVESYFAPCSHVFSVLFSIVIPSLGEERAGLYASLAFVCLSGIRYFFVFISSTCCVYVWVGWGAGGSAADCDCGSPWTFHFTFWTHNASSQENLSSGFATRVDTNRPGQPQKLGSDIETRGIILLSSTTKIFIRLRGCAGWSAPLLFAYGINRFSHDVAHILLTIGSNIIEPEHDKTNKMTYSPSEDSDQLDIHPVW